MGIDQVLAIVVIVLAAFNTVLAGVDSNWVAVAGWLVAFLGWTNYLITV